MSHLWRQTHLVYPALSRSTLRNYSQRGFPGKGTQPTALETPDVGKDEAEVTKEGARFMDVVQKFHVTSVDEASEAHRTGPTESSRPMPKKQRGMSDPFSAKANKGRLTIQQIEQILRLVGGSKWDPENISNTTGISVQEVNSIAKYYALQRVKNE
eukprot:m.47584 g.47584  ORF g.47584 m.47584 type:complete len:156 (+) comp10517_c0_seq1:100-567(+)